MTTDLAHLLQSADGGPARPDHDRILRRGRRLRLIRTTAIVGVTVVVLGGSFGVVTAVVDVPPPPVIGQPDGDEPAPTETPRTETPDEMDNVDPVMEEPSQHLADAERDGVLADVAMLPLDLRVRPELADRGSRGRSGEAEEGVWVVSRPAWHAFVPRPITVGDEAGRYGRDFVDTSGYGEVLLLDAEDGTILRAYPFPDLAPSLLLVTEDAVYCARQGDGGLPDAMLCRIDRSTLEVDVRIFPASADSHFLDPEAIWLPEHWVVDEPGLDPVFGDLDLVDGELRSVGQHATATFDPETLALLP